MTPDVTNWCHDPGMPPTPELEIVPLTSERFADLADLFATGDPRWCWYHRHVSNAGEGATKWAQSATSGSGKPQLIAHRQTHRGPGSPRSLRRDSETDGDRGRPVCSGSGTRRGRPPVARRRESA